MAEQSVAVDQPNSLFDGTGTGAVTPARGRCQTGKFRRWLGHSGRSNLHGHRILGDLSAPVSAAAEGSFWLSIRASISQCNLQLRGSEEH
jgi:hypothetical protein